MTSPTRVLAIALASAIPIAAAAASAEDAAPAAVSADLQREADRILATAYPADGPGAVAIVARGGRTIYAGGRGLADVAGKQKLDAGQVFRLGSMTKQFTAAAILTLAGEGELSLDDPIARFFPDWPEPGSRASVRQLLNHTSGIQDFSKIPGWIGRHRTRAFTTAQLIEVMRELPATAEPGAEWEYNNGGYVLLGAIIEQVTGEPWHQVVAERITRPLGLTTIAHGEQNAGGSPAALGYTLEDGAQVLATPSDLSLPSAAGGLVATPEDFARWAHALHNGKVVGPELYAQMIAPARLADGSAESYGMGFRLRRILSRPAITHGGAIAGFRTDGLYIPSEDIVVAVFANSDDPATDPDLPLRRLAALALGEPLPLFEPADIASEQIEPLFGTYSVEKGPARRFYGEDGKFYIARGQGRLEVVPAGEDRFFAPEGLAWLRFERRPDGAHQLELHDTSESEPERSVRLGELPPPLTVPAERLRAYTGTFTSEGPTFTIALDDRGKLTMSAGSATAELRPVAEHEFMSDRPPFKLVFHPEDGKFDRFTMRRGAREMHGTRVTDE